MKAMGLRLAYCRRSMFTLLSWTLLTGTVTAQVRAVGREVPADAHFYGAQFSSRVAIDPLQRITAMWIGVRLAEPREGLAVLVRRIGRGTAPERDVPASYTFYDYADIGAASDGSLAVVWGATLNRRSQIWLQLLNADRTPAGAIRLVAEVDLTFFDPLNVPTVARLSTGEMMVAWDQDPRSVFDDIYRVFGRVLSADAAALTDSFEISTPGRSSGLPAVAVAGDDFVVTWSELNDADHLVGDVGVRRYDRAGTPVGTLIVANTRPKFYAGYSVIAGASDGGFMVVWNENAAIYGRRFGPRNQPRGPARLLNSTSVAIGLTAPAVVSDGVGGFVATWVSGTFGDQYPQYGWDGSGSGVYGRRLHDDGSPDGLEFQLNTMTKGDQGLAGPPHEGLAARDGHVVATWQAVGIEPNPDNLPEVGQGIAVRRFRVRPRLSALCGDPYAQDLHRDVNDVRRILAAATGATSRPCLSCLCDTDGSGAVTIVDALRLMRKLQDKSVKLHCPPCPEGADTPAGEPSMP